MGVSQVIGIQRLFDFLLITQKLRRRRLAQNLLPLGFRKFLADSPSAQGIAPLHPGSPASADPVIARSFEELKGPFYRRFLMRVPAGNVLPHHISPSTHSSQ